MTRVMSVAIVAVFSALTISLPLGATVARRAVARRARGMVR